MTLKLEKDSIRSEEAYPKYVRLERILHDKSVLVSFSGGVDSTFLAFVVKSVCPRSLAVTANSPTLGPDELSEAKQLAKLVGIEHIVVSHDELQDEDFARNPKDRCYYCKKGLLATLQELARRKGYDVVVEGTNASDISGHRPGRRAVVETGVLSPLLEAGLTKEEIRRLSYILGLPTWNKPSMACLASRVPYNTPITHNRLMKIWAAEKHLRELGFRTVRVRDHGEVARIEVDPNRIGDLIDPTLAESVVSKFRSLGFTHIAVDLKGYRTGSMNEIADDMF